MQQQNPIFAIENGYQVAQKGVCASGSSVRNNTERQISCDCPNSDKDFRPDFVRNGC
jgi:hypothetical protein